MVTLKDVAAMAGVSPSTVSYVLNGKKTVRPETKKRIDDAVKKLDYCTNMVASSLKTNRSGTIGVVVSEMENVFFTKILCGIEEELGKFNYCMMICNAKNDAEKEKQQLRSLMGRNIDGLILIGTGESNYSYFRQMKLPMVCVDRLINETFPTIRTDNFSIGRGAAEYLLKQGKNNSVFVGNDRFHFSRERYEGYYDVMKQYNHDSSLLTFNVPSLDLEDSYTYFKKKLSKYTGKPDFDAIFAVTDRIAIGAMLALKEYGLHIPEDVGVIGVDDIEADRYTEPPLTTMKQKSTDMGRCAVKVLMKMINGEDIKRKNIYLQPELVVRKSC